MQSMLFDLDIENDIVDENYKKCTKCGKNKDAEEFSWRGGENYRRTECKECVKELSKTTKELRNIHGDAPKDYVCPICKRNFEETKGQGGKKCSSWVIDHNHETKNFRAWLCHKCNRGLGAFNDNIELLQNAIEYLKNHNKKAN